MREIRIHCSQPLRVGAVEQLDSRGFNHLKVLRLSPGQPLTLFDGQGGEYKAKLLELNRQGAKVEVLEFVAREAESQLKISLGQVISRGEKMDLTIQKAVELGVTSITPLFSERCGVKLEPARLEKKCEHWQGIISSACEQCARNQLPSLQPVTDLNSWLACQQGLCLVLSPYATRSLANLYETQPEVKSVTLLIGPEGGLTQAELKTAQQHGFIEVKLGPRILRTETAGLAMLAILQAYWGDLAVG